MTVWIVLAEPLTDCHCASVLGVYASEERAMAVAEEHEAKAKARVNSATRFWSYEVSAHEVEE